MKKILVVANILFWGLQSFSQEKPKLVIGIVVDQMRYDYIERFWDDFQEGGFKRLVNEGYFYRNCQFSYVPTFTGPGHASIFTGTTPAVHGIIANDWYNKTNNTFVYCTQDDQMHTVGAISEAGKMSPHYMLTTTFADEYQLFQESKVIGISLKDRGAILPAGHSADAAYWMDDNGQWITSSYYLSELPKYIQEINTKNPPTDFMHGQWQVKGAFSHNLDSLLVQQGVSAIKNTPFGNTILNDLALEILQKEKLGQGKTTDIFTISFSSTDYIGHQYGPHAAEIKDTYLRLDNDLAKLLKEIDQKVGFENVVLFLTADHGVVSEPKQLMQRKIPAGYFDSAALKTKLSSALSEKYGEGNWLMNLSNNQIFLNHTLVREKHFSIEEMEQFCADYLMQLDGVKNTYTAKQLQENDYQHSLHALIQQGYNQKRSGDVLFSLEAGWISNYYQNGGTTHGSAYTYDTHVPLLFWGGNIQKGKSDRNVHIQDIAPTISTLLGSGFPNGCIGNPLLEITQ